MTIQCATIFLFTDQDERVMIFAVSEEHEIPAAFAPNRIKQGGNSENELLPFIGEHTDSGGTNNLAASPVALHSTHLPSPPPERKLLIAKAFSIADSRD